MEFVKLSANLDTISAASTIRNSEDMDVIHVLDIRVIRHQIVESPTWFASKANVLALQMLLVSNGIISMTVLQNTVGTVEDTQMLLDKLCVSRNPRLTLEFVSTG
jgi:hypothetical protein